MQMQITLFGASGRTGKLVLERALAKGYRVVAPVRTPAKLAITNPNLQVLQGDVRDAAVVDTAVRGSDAVISVLGPTSNAPDFAVSKGTANIIAAMKKYGVRRLILSTGAGVRMDGDQPKFMDNAIVSILKVVNKNVLQDMIETVDLVRKSDLEWTIVRVPMLTDDAPSGHVRTGAVGKDVGTRVGRTDMADFILEQLTDASNLRRAPAISN
jgi:putative NADH-flavin reductase